MPPCAATYWSCLPTGSLRMSISISHAASASSRGGSVVRRASASAFSRQTVNAPEEPMPVPAGTSATEAISSGSPRQWRHERLAQDRVADLARVVDLLELRVLEPVAALEDRVREHVDVLVDRPADEEAAVLAVVGRQVGAAAAERDAQRRAAEDHAHRASWTISGWASSQSSVLHDGVADADGRLPAERADLRGVEVDQRAVAGPAADAAGVLEHGLDAEVRADHADRLVDDDRLVGAEVVDRACRARARARPARSGSRSTQSCT